VTNRSFDHAVLKAVNLGDDTDTIGATTGALAGTPGDESSPSTAAQDRLYAAGDWQRPHTRLAPLPT
jgi:ADP-ribosylglycohydrolase